MDKDLIPFQVEITALGFFVNRAYTLMVKLLNQELRKGNVDIQHAEFSLLKILNEIKGGSQTQIAVLLGKERAAISRTLISLEQKGYIDRHPLDGKSNYVSLTEKGYKIMPELNSIAERVTELGFQGFSQKRRESLIKNLTQVYLNAYDSID